jgi:small GTP-binding protein
MNDLDTLDPDFLLKLILVGDSGVGKTNLLTRFTHNEFNPEPKPTIGVEFATKTLQIQDKIVKTQIWDTAGQERYRAITAAYYRGALGAIVVYDVTSSKSYRSVPLWLQELRNNGDRELIILLVGNKIDLKNDRAIGTDEGIRFSRHEKLLFIETSAQDAVNVTDMFNLLIGHIVHRLSSEDVGDDTTSIKAKLVSPKGIVIAPAPEREVSSCCITRGHRQGPGKSFEVIEPANGL